MPLGMVMTKLKRKRTQTTNRDMIGMKRLRWGLILIILVMMTCMNPSKEENPTMIRRMKSRPVHNHPNCISASPSSRWTSPDNPLGWEMLRLVSVLMLDTPRREKVRTTDWSTQSRCSMMMMRESLTML